MMQNGFIRHIESNKKVSVGLKKNKHLKRPIS